MKRRHLKFTTGILSDSDAKNSQKYTGSWVISQRTWGPSFEKRRPFWPFEITMETIPLLNMFMLAANTWTHRLEAAAKSQLTFGSPPEASRCWKYRTLNVRFHKITNDSSDLRNVPWIFPKKWQLEKLSWRKSYWAKCLQSICSQWRCYLSNMYKIIQSLSHVQTTYHIYMKLFMTFVVVWNQLNNVHRWLNISNNELQ